MCMNLKLRRGSCVSPTRNMARASARVPRLRETESADDVGVVSGGTSSWMTGALASSIISKVRARHVAIGCRVEDGNPKPHV